MATAQGLGGALSAGLAGAIIVAMGYQVAFWTLAAIAAIGLFIYAVLMPEPGRRKAAADPIPSVNDR